MQSPAPNTPSNTAPRDSGKHTPYATQATGQATGRAPDPAAPQTPSPSTPAAARFDLLGLGEAMIEFNQLSPQQPQYQQGFGGDTSNATIAAARAGARCAYLSRVGDDAFGESLRALWQAEGVDHSGVDSGGGESTGVYFVSHGEQGHRFSYLRSQSAATRMAPDWLHQGPGRALIEASRLLHVSGISMGISASACDAVFEAMALARQAGRLVSLDSNLRLKLWPLARARACLAEATAQCDYFLPSLEDAVLLSGHSEPHAVVDWAHRLGAPVVVLKLGAQGALVSDGERRLHWPGWAVPLVDATGAGDCFCGNLLARLAQGMDVFEAARHANAAAALAVQGFGAVAPLPDAAAVSRLLGQSG